MGWLIGEKRSDHVARITARESTLAHHASGNEDWYIFTDDEGKHIGLVIWEGNTSHKFLGEASTHSFMAVRWSGSTEYRQPVNRGGM